MTTSNLFTELLGEDWIEENVAGYQVFRQRWSPSLKWSHRLPTTSPLVPLLYWNTVGTWESLDAPMGTWEGQPKEIWNRLTEELEEFRPYWDDGGIRSNNLSWALREPQRFYSLSHELSLAFFFAKRQGVSVDPLFLDPGSPKGSPDIVLDTESGGFAVQCKSEDPTQKGSLTYDQFQFLTGVYQRLVEDSGKSYHLSLRITKDRFEIKDTYALRTRLRQILSKGITTPSPMKGPGYELELCEVGEGPGMVAPARLMSRVIMLGGEPLYTEGASLGRSRQSSLFISGKRGKEVYMFIESAMTHAVRHAVTDLPLLIAVHLYQDIAFDEFSQRLSTREKLLPWTDLFFERNRTVPMILVSSNHERYSVLDLGPNVALKHGRNMWVVESPNWDHKDVEVLGV